MRVIQVGVRELKSRLSDYLKHVKSGQTVIVTEHGKPIGQIIPVVATLEERLHALAQAGLIIPADKKKLPALMPVITNQSGHSISDLVSEDRDFNSIPKEATS